MSHPDAGGSSMLPSRRGVRWAVVVVPVAYLEVLHLLSGAVFDWRSTLLGIAWLLAVLVGARYAEPELAGGEREELWPWPILLISGLGVASGALYVVTQAAWAAWILLGAFFCVLLVTERALVSRSKAINRILVLLLLATIAGLVPVAIGQIESRFAEEEFFAALQVLALSSLWVILWAARRLQHRWEPVRTRHYGIRCSHHWLIAALIVGTVVGGYSTVRAYQQSFYPLVAPEFAGISRESPFLCGTVRSSLSAPDGPEVFGRLLARVEAAPQKGPPEYGMLALGTGDLRWAQRFRESLLSEATDGRFTDPANSVKSVQYDAALRAYYYPRVREEFPDLFSENEQILVKNWFAAINRRAMTVEWVDWMYGLAFSKRPEGAYENQEMGAGLLSLLEVEHLADDGLSSANQDYLERNRRGWLLRFRNTDDAFPYQLEWINDARFQSLYSDAVSPDNIRLSFEWLLAQALPDGAPLTYNHPERPYLAGVAYAGANLLRDPRYIWLAARVLQYAEAHDQYLLAQPGVEKAFRGAGQAPTQGSCLLYGDSGLPNQVGPLAPDKIVFRDGWSDDSSYLLLDLRFTGWHRYKATNTIALVYRRGALAAEMLDGKPFGWLPEGRALFRDKRVPRENLNGLLVERSGMSSVLYSLAGTGGPWAQDPPYYAKVVAFETGTELDWSHTQMAGWRGWQHDRWIYFYHGGGPIIVADRAKGPPGGRVALAWHLVGAKAENRTRIRLQVDDHPAELLLIPILPEEPPDYLEGGDRVSSQYSRTYFVAKGQLRSASVFLFDEWVGAEAGFDAQEQALWIAKGERRITVPLS